MSILKLKELYKKLSPQDQREALFQLTASTKKMDVDTSTVIAEFCVSHQKEFKKDATFTVEITHAGIFATVQTMYGKFKGAGPNQKIAKLNAIREAEDSRKEPTEKQKPKPARKSATKAK